jgi:hypothetical protein
MGRKNLQCMPSHAPKNFYSTWKLFLHLQEKCFESQEKSLNVKFKIIRLRLADVINRVFPMIQLSRYSAIWLDGLFMISDIKFFSSENEKFTSCDSQTEKGKEN